MLFIGITGGVGAGKSEILSYLEQKKDVRVMLADEIAHQVMEPKEEAYMEICRLFQGEDIFPDGTMFDEESQKFPLFDRKKLAQVIFSNQERREQLNQIVHPAVRNYVKKQFQFEKERDIIRVLVLEAALLIEEHYDEFCDEFWYIYTSEDNRRARLKAARGYSDEKIDSIFRCQLKEESFREACLEVIDNNGSREESFHQIDQALKNAWKRNSEIRKRS